MYIVIAHTSLLNSTLTILALPLCLGYMLFIGFTKLHEWLLGYGAHIYIKILYPFVCFYYFVPPSLTTEISIKQLYWIRSWRHFIMSRILCYFIAEFTFLHCVLVLLGNILSYRTLSTSTFHDYNINHMNS